jgi:hypothetical protein
MEWSDEEVRELFDEWFERAVDSGTVDDRDYTVLLKVYIAGFRDGLERV